MYVTEVLLIVKMVFNITKLKS